MAVDEMKQWMERECPRCVKCGQRTSEGRVIGVAVYCMKCFGEEIQAAEQAYLQMPMHDGKISVRRPKD